MQIFKIHSVTLQPLPSLSVHPSVCPSVRQAVNLLQQKDMNNDILSVEMCHSLKMYQTLKLNKVIIHQQLHHFLLNDNMKT